MKKILLLIITFITLSLSSFSQVFVYGRTPVYIAINGNWFQTVLYANDCRVCGSPYACEHRYTYIEYIVPRHVYVSREHCHYKKPPMKPNYHTWHQQPAHAVHHASNEYHHKPVHHNEPVNRCTQSTGNRGVYKSTTSQHRPESSSRNSYNNGSRSGNQTGRPTSSSSRSTPSTRR